MLFRHARARTLAAAVLTTTGLATVAAAAAAAPGSAASATAHGQFPGPASHAVFVQNDNVTGNQVVAYKRPAPSPWPAPTAPAAWAGS